MTSLETTNRDQSKTEKPLQPFSWKSLKQKQIIRPIVLAALASLGSGAIQPDQAFANNTSKTNNQETVNKNKTDFIGQYYTAGDSVYQFAQNRYQKGVYLKPSDIAIQIAALDFEARLYQNIENKIIKLIQNGMPRDQAFKQFNVEPLKPGQNIADNINAAFIEGNFSTSFQNVIENTFNFTDRDLYQKDLAGKSLLTSQNLPINEAQPSPQLTTQAVKKESPLPITRTPNNLNLLNTAKQALLAGNKTAATTQARQIEQQQQLQNKITTGKTEIITFITNQANIAKQNTNQAVENFSNFQEQIAASLRPKPQPKPLVINLDTPVLNNPSVPVLPTQSNSNNFTQAPVTPKPIQVAKNPDKISPPESKIPINPWLAGGIASVASLFAFNRKPKNKVAETKSPMETLRDIINPADNDQVLTSILTAYIDLSSNNPIKIAQEFWRINKENPIIKNVLEKNAYTLPNVIKPKKGENDLAYQKFITYILAGLDRIFNQTTDDVEKELISQYIENIKKARALNINFTLSSALNFPKLKKEISNSTLRIDREIYFNSLITQILENLVNEKILEPQIILLETQQTLQLPAAIETGAVAEIKKPQRINIIQKISDQATNFKKEHSNAFDKIKQIINKPFTDSSLKEFSKILDGLKGEDSYYYFIRHIQSLITKNVLKNNVLRDNTIEILGKTLYTNLYDTLLTFKQEKTLGEIQYKQIQELIRMIFQYFFSQLPK